MKTTVYSVQTCQQVLIVLKMALHFQVLSVTMTLHQSGAYCNNDIAVRWLLKQCHCSQVLGVTMTLQSGDWCNNDNAVRCLLSQRKCSQVLSATMTLYVVAMCKVYQCHCNHVLVQNSYIRVRCLVQRWQVSQSVSQFWPYWRVFPLYMVGLQHVVAGVKLGIPLFLFTPIP